MDDVDVVTMVATKSSNLKGGYVRALKDAARSIKEVIDAIASRPHGEEQTRLEIVNESLVKTNSELKAEIEVLRNEDEGNTEGNKWDWDDSPTTTSTLSLHGTIK